MAILHVGLVSSTWKFGLRLLRPSTSPTLAISARFISSINHNHVVSQSSSFGPCIKNSAQLSPLNTIHCRFTHNESQVDVENKKKELEEQARAKRQQQLIPFSKWQIKAGEFLINFFNLRRDDGQPTNYQGEMCYIICTMPADQNREFFFGACQLPDTFQSWFLVTQLHVWMLLVRLRAEGEQGRRFSQMIVESFFHDIQKRIGTFKGVKKGEAVKIFLSQHHGCSLAYDTGIYSDDTVLASSLWRNLTAMEGDAVTLALLVQYVRSQVQMLDNLSSEKLLTADFMWGEPIYELEGVEHIKHD